MAGIAGKWQGRAGSPAKAEDRGCNGPRQGQKMNQELTIHGKGHIL